MRKIVASKARKNVEQLITVLAAATAAACIAPADDAEDDVRVATSTQAVTVARTPVQVAVGGLHSCARFDTGEIACWGGNFSGELGVGDNAYRGHDATPIPVTSFAPRRAIQIAAGEFHTGVLLDDGTVRLWGSHGGGALGWGSASAVSYGSAPGELANLAPPVNLGTDNAGKAHTAIGIVAGAGYTCVLLRDKSVRCFGSNSDGKLGIGKTNESWGKLPSEQGDGLPRVDLGTQANGLPETAEDLVATTSYSVFGGGGTCARLTSGGVKCWGPNGHGEAGDENPNVPVHGQVPGTMGNGLSPVLLPFRPTSIGGYYAVSSDGRVKSWGSGVNGRHGRNDGNTSATSSAGSMSAYPFVDLGAGFLVRKVSSGMYTACAISTSAELKCWGRNTYGTLGIGLGGLLHKGDNADEMGDHLPKVALGGGAVADVAAGEEHVCAVVGGGVKCWGGGYQSLGQLGVGDDRPRGEIASDMGSNLPYVRFSTEPALGMPVLASSFFSDAAGWDDARYAASVRAADVNGDGLADLFGRGAAGIWVQRSTGSGFGAATLASGVFSDTAGFNMPEYGSTVQAADLDGDGKADLFGRGRNGISAQLATASGFGPEFLASSFFRDTNGFNLPAYYPSIQAADINGDGMADFIGRGGAGIYVQLATGGGAFSPAVLAAPYFSNANGWDSPDAQILRAADINGDGKADLIGRNVNGIYVQLAVGGGWFGDAQLVSSFFSNANGWAPATYHASIGAADLNGDGKADLYGRGAAGMFVQFAQGGATFGPATLMSTFFSDSRFGLPAHSATIRAADVNGDGRADLLGRASSGEWLQLF